MIVRAKVYVVQSLATAIAAFMALAVLNISIDPYSIWWRYESGAALCSKLTFNRLSKPHWIRSVRPRTVLLGTSRAMLGFDPASFDGISVPRPVFNAAVTAASVHEMALSGEDALSLGTVETMIIGLDFFQFAAGKQTRAGFDPARLATPGDLFPRWTPLAADIVPTLLSFDATRKSLGALEESMLDGREGAGPCDDLPSNTYTLDARGFTLDTSLAHAIARGVRMKSLFVGELSRHYYSVYNHFILIKILREPERGGLAGLLRSAADHGVKVVMFISPSHTTMWELLASRDLWESWELWKKDLSLLTEEVRQARDLDLTLWDFSGFNRVSTESIPPETGRQEMSNYWEASHFKPSVGHMILEIAVGRTKASDGFGVEVTPENIDRHLARIRQDRLNWREHNRDEVDLVQRIVEDLKKQGY